jgi:hypothetical protein
MIKNTLKLCCRLCNIDATLSEGCIARHYSAPHLCKSLLSMHVSEHRSFLFSSHSLGTELGRHHKVAWTALGCVGHAPMPVAKDVCYLEAQLLH